MSKATFPCPVTGCDYRGPHNGVFQHTKSKHPSVSREEIASAIKNGGSVAAPKPVAAVIVAKAARHPSRWRWFLGGATVTLIILAAGRFAFVAWQAGMF